jgi:hypothetical protein
MTFIHMASTPVNTEYIQYAHEENGRMLVVFGEGASTKSASSRKSNGRRLCRPSCSRVIRAWLGGAGPRSPQAFFLIRPSDSVARLLHIGQLWKRGS